MNRHVFLHVGLPKSGTTYAQAVMVRNKAQLQTQGLLFPGEWNDQVLAVRDVRELRTPEAQRPRVSGAWDRLVHEIRSWHGDAVISMEWLCAAEERHIEKIVTDLADADVHVIFTVRDLGRTLPAAWQEFMQNRQPWTWREFLEGVTADDPWATGPGRGFWSQQDLDALIRRWNAVVPIPQIHVVTLPQSGAPPDALWQRLCEVFGIHGDGHVTQGLGGNVSLGLESADIMRRLNVAVRGERKSLEIYNGMFKHGLAKEGLARRRGVEAKLSVPVEYHTWLRARAQEQIEALRTSGVDVVGSLDELVPVLGTGDEPQPDDIDPERLLDAAVDGLLVMGNRHLAATDQLRARHREQVEALRQELEEAREAALPRNMLRSLARSWLPRSGGSPARPGGRP